MRFTQRSAVGGALGGHRGPPSGGRARGDRPRGCSGGGARVREGGGSASPAPKLVVDGEAQARRRDARRPSSCGASDAVARGAVTALHRSMPGVGKRKQQKVRGKLKAGAAGDGGIEPGRFWCGAGCAGVRAVARQLGGCEGAKPKSWRRDRPQPRVQGDGRGYPVGVLGGGVRVGPDRAAGLPPQAQGVRVRGVHAKADAERAVREVNGAAIAGRQVAVDWALSSTPTPRRRQRRRRRRRRPRGATRTRMRPAAKATGMRRPAAKARRRRQFRFRDGRRRRRRRFFPATTPPRATTRTMPRTTRWMETTTSTPSVRMAKLHHERARMMTPCFVA